MIKKLNIEEKTFSTLWEWKKLEFKSWKLAPQADWSVLVRLWDTTLLVTAVMNKNPDPNKDFMPLTVDFRESYYAWWKIWWNPYQKREWKPHEHAILRARLTDRPIRPMFPEGMVNDVVVTITPLSVDRENSPWVPAIIGASLAIMLGGIPIEWPIGAVRIGYKDGNFIINPTYEEIENWILDLVIAWTEDTITMVECWAKEVPTDILMKAFEIAKEEIKKVCKWQKEFLSQFDIKQQEITINKPSEDLIAFVKQIIWLKLEQLMNTDKKTFWELYEKFEEEVFEAAKDKIENEENEIFTESKVKMAVFKVVKEFVRNKILKEEKRVDWRKLDEIRPLYTEVWLIPRVHWSWLFQRWETQVLSVTTLWAPWDVQLLDTMEHDETEKRFMHHYNMPPFSTWEARPTRAPNRREIGHWRLAERALEAVIPSEEEFPYTIRIVSEVLSSNGSTSMASVCASTLSLMDAWVPIKAPVSGIAMWLVSDYDENWNFVYKVLTDIQWVEDFCWDMDFKVAWTKKGITALQMDMKIKWLKLEVIKDAIEKANKARNEILDFMLQTISQPRPQVSIYAPQMIKIKLTPSQIRDVIWPWGATIQEIIKQTWVKIDFKDDWTTIITARNQKDWEKALQLIKEASWQPQEGEIIEWTITRVEPYGVFVKLGKNKLWLCHISKLGPWFVGDPRMMFKEWQKIRVKIIKVEDDWKIQLQRVF